MHQNKKGFTLVEFVVSLIIMTVIFGFFFSLLRSSSFFGNFEDRKVHGATKKVISDINSVFLQHGINSGAVISDNVPTKVFERIGLVYSGGTVIIGVIDKSTFAIFDVNANDNGFLGMKIIPQSMDFTTYTGTLDPIDLNLNITGLKTYISSGLLRMEISYDNEVMNGNHENYLSGILLYEKNYNY